LVLVAVLFYFRLVSKVGNRMRAYLTVLSVTVFWLAGGVAFGAKLGVPTPYADIKTALAAAGPCDTVLLDSGIYSGPGFRELYFSDSLCVSIVSRDGATSTVIDLQGSYFCDGANFAGSPPHYILISGIQFKHGNPAIHFCTRCEPLIVYCVFTDCKIGIEAGHLAGSYSGGVFYSDFRDNDTAIYGPHEPWLRIGYCSFLRNYDAVTGADYPSYDIWLCTFVRNVNSGFVVQEFDLAWVHHNVFYQNGCGVLSYGPPEYWINRLVCNDFYDNVDGNYCGIPDQTGTNGNFSANPEYCDTSFASFTLGSVSALLAANNSCRAPVGHTQRVECYCGDVDVSGNVDISDITVLIAYLYLGGPPPTPLEAGEIDSEEGIDISDLTVLIAYLYLSGPKLACGNS
jgi:hypothetical protein